MNTHLPSLVEYGELYFTYFIIIVFIKTYYGGPQAVLRSATQQKLKIKEIK